MILRASHLAATPALRSNIHILRLKGTKESSSSYLPRCGLYTSLSVPPRHVVAWLRAGVLVLLLFPVQCLRDTRPILWGLVDLFVLPCPREALGAF